MSVSPMLLGERHRILPVLRHDNRGEYRYDLLGDTPSPTDVVAQGIALPELTPGDCVLIQDTGAYFTSMGTEISGSRPSIVWLGDRGPRVVAGPGLA